MEIWDVIRADLHRYDGDASFSSFVKHYLATPGFKYTFWMRLSAHLRKGKTTRLGHYFCRAMLHRCSIRYGISIPYNTRIGAGLYIGHFGGIVVNGEVVIGRDCNVNHGVTIGAKYGGKNAGVPVIGNRVYLGPGCSVIGGIRVGDRVVVGTNAVVAESVADSAVVAGVPAKLISLDGSAQYVVNTTDAMVAARANSAVASGTAPDRPKA